MNSVKLNTLVHKLERSSRKTISLQVNPLGQLIIKAPHKVSIQYINDLVNNKLNWINKKIIEVKSKTIEEKKWNDGEKVHYLGNEYPLRIIQNEKFAIKFENGEFLLAEDCKNYAIQYFQIWFKKQAKHFLVNRTIEIAKQFNLSIHKVKITSATSRWGSCSSKKNINLNWKLILLPKNIIDYVIIHELAHTKEMNHSEKFWKLVEIMEPNYKENRKWLKNESYYTNFY